MVLLRGKTAVEDGMESRSLN